MTKADTVTRY